MFIWTLRDFAGMALLAVFGLTALGLWLYGKYLSAKQRRKKNDTEKS